MIVFFVIGVLLIKEIGFVGLIYLGFLFCSQYLQELLAEHQKLGPFTQVLPVCSRLLNQGCISNPPSFGSRFFWILMEIAVSPSLLS